MNTLAKAICIVGTVFLLAGCGAEQESDAGALKYRGGASSTMSAPSPTNQTEADEAGRSEMAPASSVATSDSTAADAMPFSSSAAVETGKDSTRKFIRTADIKFRVKSVTNSTYEIENLTGQMDGFVAFTNLNSTIDKQTLTPISSDSSLEATYYTVVNSMQLRVPNTKLDTTLKSIVHLIDYLDYRNIKAENVSLQILGSDMARKRLEEHQRRLRGAIDTKARRLDETTTAEDNLLNRQGESDATLLSNLSLNDQIQYSTINLSIYQREAATKTVIANDKNIDEYTPGIGSRIVDALYGGWRALESVAVFLMQFWALYIVLIVFWIAYKRFR